MGFAATRGGALERVMFIVQDERALRRIGGALASFSRRKYSVHVGVADDPPGAPPLGRHNGRYPGVTVAQLPMIVEDPWRSLAAVVRVQLGRLWAREPEDDEVGADAGALGPAVGGLWWRALDSRVPFHHRRP